jgi:hypothetical protein
MIKSLDDPRLRGGIPCQHCHKGSLVEYEDWPAAVSQVVNLKKWLIFGYLHFIYLRDIQKLKD